MRRRKRRGQKERRKRAKAANCADKGMSSIVPWLDVVHFVFVLSENDRHLQCSPILLKSDAGQWDKRKERRELKSRADGNIGWANAARCPCFLYWLLYYALGPVAPRPLSLSLSLLGPWCIYSFSMVRAPS